MNLQESQLHFFERLYLELPFSSVPPRAEEILNCINTSRSTHLIYTNLSSGETLEGPFYLEKNFLVYYQAEMMELPDVILDLSYARLHTIFRGNEKSTTKKIHLEKNQNTYKIVFDDQNTYEDWMLKLRKICILTNFEKKYQIAEMTEKKGDVCECLLEAKMGGTHYSARKFDKRQITESENSLGMIRLMNEIEILRALRTERVIHLNEVYETEDSIYLVTDAAHNLTLKKMLKATSSLFSEAKTRSIMHQILKVLAHMASKNITHRNLKPSNIMMENKHKIRIINFGLASFVNAPKANVKICGTPGYIAPEILNCHNENRVYDDKTDVFSAGCIFFEMLLGYPLFKGSKTSEISSSNKHFEYSELVQVVTKELKNAKLKSTKFGLDLLLKLLHNDPKQRLSAEEALGGVYFDSQESFPSSNESTPLNIKERSVESSARNSLRVSFDISPSTSISPLGSFSEAINYHESSALHPSSNSPRKSSGDYYKKCLSPSNFKNQPRFKSVQEVKLPVVNEKRSSELLILQKIDLTASKDKDDEDCESLFGESSPLSKNFPIKSPRIQHHPSQRI